MGTGIYVSQISLDNDVSADHTIVEKNLGHIYLQEIGCSSDASKYKQLQNFINIIYILCVRTLHPDGKLVKGKT